MNTQAEFCPAEPAGKDIDFYTYSPHKVLSAFDKGENIKAAIDELKAKHFKDKDIEVFCGRQGEERLEFNSERHGYWEMFVHSLQGLASEGRFLEFYQKELHAGHFLLTVQADTSDKKERATEILHSHGGHRVTYFGHWLIEVIKDKKPANFDSHPYGYRREFDFPFAESVARTREALKKEGFGVLCEIDMKEKLKSTLDIDFRNYTILGACHPQLAHQALQKDLDLGLLLPCNAIVYEWNSGSVVAAIDAGKMLSVAANPDLEATAETVNEKLRRVIDSL